MESLYVCLFSNGHIKVGRSIDAISRIAQHAERVACMGVMLINQYVTARVTDADAREAVLIDRCVAAARTRFKNEWFEGLDFAAVSGWADEAALQSADSVVSPLRAVRQKLGMTQTDLAAALGCTQGNIGFIERGQTLMPDMAKRLIRFARSKGFAVTYEDLYGAP